MSRQSNSKVRERNREIVRLYREEQKSISVLASEYGQSVDNIRRILKEEGVVLRQKVRKGERSYKNREPLSTLHSAIGSVVSHKRHIEKSLTMSEFAIDARLSEIKLSHGEKGMHDFTLGELMRISRTLGVPLLELLLPTSSLIKRLCNGETPEQLAESYFCSPELVRVLRYGFSATERLKPTITRP